MPRARRQPERPKSDDPAVATLTVLLPLHAARSPEWLADAAATAAEQLLAAPFAFVYLQGEDGALRRVVPASDLRRRSQKRAIDALGDRAIALRVAPEAAPAFTGALEGGEPVTVPVAEALRGLAAPAAAAAASEALGVAAASLLPLEWAGERAGVLVLLARRGPEAERLRLLGQHVACAVANLRLAVAVRDESAAEIARAVFDARKLDAELQKELARAARYRRSVSIAVVEATNLRLLRERFGPALTERLLERLGGALARDARDIDVIGAYRQSGYTMVLTEATAEGAAQAARRLLQTAQQAGLADERVPGLELHVVCGWATAPADGETSEQLFATAERRMYDPSQQVA